MPIDMTPYGDLTDADEYFANRLHDLAWSGTDVLSHPKALWGATQIIDALNFKGDKHSVWQLLQSNPEATQEQIRAADASQPREFPRGADTEVPNDILIACFEIAYSLLDGKDPELELESLATISQGFSSVRTTYARNQSPNMHTINGVPSYTAWKLLQPFLRDPDSVRLSRVS